MAKNFLVRMLKGAAGPKLEGKALDAGRTYPLSAETVKFLELSGFDTKDKEQAAAKAEKEKKIGPGFRGDTLEILKELGDEELQEIREREAEARAKSTKT